MTSDIISYICVRWAVNWYQIHKIMSISHGAMNLTYLMLAQIQQLSYSLFSPINRPFEPLFQYIVILDFMIRHKHSFGTLFITILQFLTSVIFINIHHRDQQKVSLYSLCNILSENNFQFDELWSIFVESRSNVKIYI